MTTKKGPAYQSTDPLDCAQIVPVKVKLLQTKPNGVNGNGKVYQFCSLGYRPPAPQAIRSTKFKQPFMPLQLPEGLTQNLVY
ncbi:MAG: hypothetical protein P4L69_17465 [Desulfosporosinus sp.]|nr:hypothetical protein [Desulfosporosinus sp.]